MYIAPIPASNGKEEENPEQLQIKEDVKSSVTPEETAIQETEEIQNLSISGTVTWEKPEARHANQRSRIDGVIT